MNLLKIAGLAVTIGLITANVSCSKDHRAFGRDLSVGAISGAGKPSTDLCPADFEGLWQVTNPDGSSAGEFTFSTDKSTGQRTLLESGSSILKIVDGAAHTDAGLTYTAACADGKLNFQFDQGSDQVQRIYSALASGTGSIIEIRKNAAQNASVTYTIRKK